jgi:hypothetical protein
LYYAVKQQYGETPQYYNDKTLWSGDDSSSARKQAATNLTNYINNYHFKSGEKLNIVGHSHGGNIAKLVSQWSNVKVDNLVTIETPVRTDYKTNYENVSNMIETYSRYDIVQIHGGGESTFRGNEYGEAGDCERVSNCIDVTRFTTPGTVITGYRSITAHSDPYTNLDSLQTIFPRFNQNVLNYNRYYMGAVQINANTTKK